MITVTDEQISSIPGAFWAPDIDIFRALLRATASYGGDLAEMGVSHGASAVLIGSFLAPSESFTVVDLFDSEQTDSANVAENKASYLGLTRATFEENYRHLLGSLPIVVHGLSSSITSHAGHGAHRFVHVDASHLYDHVREDIDNAKVLLKPDGILVLGDFRQAHTPGVAAAAWQAVVKDDLRPFLLSPNKFYATWGDGIRWQDAVGEWARRTGTPHEFQVINDLRIMRILPQRAAPPPPHPFRRYVPEAMWPQIKRTAERLRVVENWELRQ